MATYLEKQDRTAFTEQEQSSGREVALALGLKQIDSCNFRSGRRYIGFRGNAIQVQGLDNEAAILLALATYATRFTTDTLILRNDNKIRCLTELLPIHSD